MDQLYMENSYLKEFDATVTSVKDGKFIVLDKTAFYPNGGGQPYDMGKLVDEQGNEYNVVYVGKFSGSISHEVDKEGLKEGDKVKGIIDWKRRYRLMQMHTASHVLSTVLYNKYKVLITGNQLGIEKSRDDYSLDKFDREEIQRAVDETNEVLSRNLDVTMETMPREEAMKIEGVTKLATSLPENIKELRIVKIGDFDMQADGGTHVKNTKECGKMLLVKLDNKGKNNRRLYWTLTE